MNGYYIPLFPTNTPDNMIEKLNCSWTMKWTSVNYYSQSQRPLEILYNNKFGCSTFNVSGAYSLNNAQFLYRSFTDMIVGNIVSRYWENAIFRKKESDTKGERGLPASIFCYNTTTHQHHCHCFHTKLFELQCLTYNCQMIATRNVTGINYYNITISLST